MRRALREGHIGTIDPFDSWLWPHSSEPREVLKVGDLAVKKSWSDQNLSEFSKVNLIGQI